MNKPSIPAGRRPSFREELAIQRWDDHRYYHHSRINQSLHLLSASCFLVTYAMLVVNPGAAALLGWMIAMTSRQIGHFVFEPRTYDEVNQASHEHKEEIKVGYNLFRKRVLQSVWALTPFVLWVNPSFFGAFEPHTGVEGFVANLGLLWLWLAVLALLLRTIHLFFISGIQTGLVWATKILTDPFHDFKIYLKSPLYLFRGEFIDPMGGVRDNDDERRDDDEPAMA